MAGRGAHDGTADFEALARQYWDAWADAARAATSGLGGAGTGFAGGPAAGSRPSIDEAVRWWSSMAQQVTGNADAHAAAGRFDAQARTWLAQMQQLASQFAGRPSSAADIAQAWRGMLGAHGNPFADLMQQMQGPQARGFDAWYAQVRPFLGGMMAGAMPTMPFAGGWADAARGALSTPAFGFAREHQERWQALAQAQLDYQERMQAHNALLAEATQDAVRRFESKLAEREEPGREVRTARALFDLWIDAAEDAYAEVALSTRFRETYGAMVNAQMRLRAAVEREVAQVSALFGMPTRDELDATHRKVTALERELRRVRDELARREAPPAPSPQSRPVATAASPTAADPVGARRAAPKPSPSAKPARKPDAKAPGKRGVGARAAGTSTRRGERAPAPKATSAWVKSNLPKGRAR